ncbi:hypothetical protein BV22DRAFT_1050969 [Leucogyrophana mollusca]|uniref:Uncharacterized protein n=1 Tax=Leucogyrophana mollusca TaxID=85980 RepID=A0ACB8B1Z4_9AGAM|nr:hypothetical protein BV22DRAFT_1050969 [Leucogyrophana mollusca]
MSAINPLQNAHSTFIHVFHYKDDPKSPWVSATMSRPLPIKFGDHLIVKAISSRPRSWFFGVVTGVARLEKDWAILELTPSKADYGQYTLNTPFLLAILMSWTRLPSPYHIQYTLLLRSNHLPWITAHVYGNNAPILSFNEHFYTPPPQWLIDSHIIPGVPLQSHDVLDAP